MFPLAMKGKTIYGEESGVSKHTPRRPRMWAWLKSFIRRLSVKKAVTSSSVRRSMCECMCLCCLFDCLIVCVCLCVYVCVCDVCVCVRVRFLYSAFLRFWASNERYQRPQRRKCSINCKPFCLKLLSSKVRSVINLPSLSQPFSSCAMFPYTSPYLILCNVSIFNFP